MKTTIWAAGVLLLGVALSATAWTLRPAPEPQSRPQTNAELIGSGARDIEIVWPEDMEPTEPHPAPAEPHPAPAEPQTTNSIWELLLLPDEETRGLIEFYIAVAGLLGQILTAGGVAALLATLWKTRRRR